MNDVHGDDPGELVFQEDPMDEVLKIEVLGKVVWEGTRAQFVGMYDRLASSKLTTSDMYGLIYGQGLKPDTEYRIVEELV